MVKKLPIIILLLLIFGCKCFPQKRLEILFTRFGSLKKFELFVGDQLDYKLKGQHRFKRNKITNLQDSFIVFSNDTVIALEQLKTIRFHKHNILITILQKGFIVCGGGFFLLNTTNNLINDRSPILNEKVGLICAALVATGVLIKQLNIRRIRMNEHKQLKIIDLSFDNLSEKPRTEQN